MEEINVYRDRFMSHIITEHPDPDTFTMHVHDTCEIYYFYDGDASYMVEGTSYPLKKGSLLIMRPFESHRAKLISSRRYERFCINFPPDLFDSLDEAHFLMRPFFNRPLGRGNLYNYEDFSRDLYPLFLYLSSLNTTVYEDRVKNNVGLLELLAEINRAFDGKPAESFLPPESAAERIISYINAHLTEDLSVPKLAERFFLSPSQFTRIFHTAAGTSPWDYIIIKRLLLAKEYIDSGIPKQKAALMAGFSDYSSYYRANKKPRRPLDRNLRGNE